MPSIINLEDVSEQQFEHDHFGLKTKNPSVVAESDFRATKESYATNPAEKRIKKLSEKPQVEPEVEQKEAVLDPCGEETTGVRTGYEEGFSAASFRERGNFGFFLGLLFLSWEGTTLL